MKYGATAMLASVVSAGSSYVKVAQSDSSYGGLGLVEGFTYPQMGGQNGVDVFAGAYTAGEGFLGEFNSDGFVSGLNQSTVTDVGSPLLAFGDFAVSRASTPSGDVAKVFVSSTVDYDGVFLQLPGGIVTIATTQNTWEGNTFNVLSNPAVEISHDQAHALVAFEAKTGAYSSGWRGILLAKVPLNAPAVVSLLKVVDNKMSMPGTSNIFKCITSPAVSQTGDVVFFGSQCGSSRASEMVTDQFNNLVKFKGEPVSQHALTKHRQVGVPDLHAGVWRWSAGTILALANENTQVPGGPHGEGFMSFSQPAIGIDGTVGFVALGNNGSYGMYKTTSSGLAVIANKQVAVPGYEDKFQNFPQPPSFDKNGNAVFYGQSTAKIAGVFAETSSGLATVLNEDDLIGGYNTVYVGFGANAVSTDKAAVYLVLSDSDSTNGVWIFDVPTSADDVALV